jgi:hypothetical protein
MQFARQGTDEILMANKVHWELYLYVAGQAHVNLRLQPESTNNIHWYSQVSYSPAELHSWLSEAKGSGKINFGHVVKDKMKTYKPALTILTARPFYFPLTRLFIIPQDPGSIVRMVR